mgnify:CR=1 FL=1
MNKIEAWKTKLSEQGNSGMTQVNWCVDNNISLSKFRYWKRKVDSTEPAETNFLELSMESPVATAICLEVSGVNINVFPGVDPDLLKEVILVAKSC